MLSRIIWDCPSTSNCLHFGCDGSVIAATKETIMSYRPHLKHGIGCETHWITITRKTSEIKDGAQVSPADWFHSFRGSNSEYKILSFLNVHSCKNVLANDGSPLLCTLLSNGTVLLFQRDISSNECYDQDLLQIKLCGFSLLFDFMSIYSAWCAKQEIASTITSFSLCTRGKDSVSLAIGGRSQLSVWSIALKDGHIVCQLWASVDINTIHAEGEISSLFASNIDASSVNVLVGMTSGMVHCMRVATIDNNGCITLVSSHSYGPTVISNFIPSKHGDVIVVSGNKIHVHDQSRKFGCPVSGVVPLPRLSVTKGDDQMLCCTIDGKYCTWSADNLAHNTGESSRDVRMACGLPSNDVLNVHATKSVLVDKSGLFGLVSDPLELLIVSAVKINPVHDNSRETQLTKGTTRSHLEIRWVSSPVLPTDTCKPPLEWNSCCLMC